MIKSFFEFISMADSERVHSQTIGWIFSDNCTAISKQDKEILLQQITKCSDSLHIKAVFIEIDNVDILIQCEDALIIIENKIKISQHDDQLSRYVEYAKKRAIELNITYNQLHYIYLTLDKESADAEPWKNVSYQELLDSLKLCEKVPGAEAIILDQYLNTVERILNAINSAIKDDGLRSWCFANTGVKKADLLHPKVQQSIKFFLKGSKYIDTANYLVETGMIRLIQKIYFKRVLAEMDKRFLEQHFSSMAYDASVSTGEGLVQLTFKDLVINYKELRLIFGYQIQNQTLKVNVAHEEYMSSKKTDLPPGFRNLLVRIKSVLGYTGRISTGVTKAYGSVTERQQFDPANRMSPTELARFIEADVRSRNYTALLREIVREYQLEIR